MTNKPPTITRPKLINKEAAMILILFGTEQIVIKLPYFGAEFLFQFYAMLGKEM
jgi:hypothetical protein